MGKSDYMPRKKIFPKLKFNNYNAVLEQALEKKEYPNLAKNLILSILYKIENNYKDYKHVKRDVSKEEDIAQNLINEVTKNCNRIIIIRPKTPKSQLLEHKNEKYFLNENEKRLEALPKERVILQGIYELGNANYIQEKYGLLAKAYNYVLKKGKSSNMAEIIRDFNGFSWYVDIAEFEDIYANLFFQNLRIIAGNDLVSEMTNCPDPNKDYLVEIKKELEKRLGKIDSDEMLNQLNVTVLKIYIEKHKKEIDEVLKNTKNQNPQNSQGKGLNLNNEINQEKELLTELNELKSFIKSVKQKMDGNNDLHDSQMNNQYMTQNEQQEASPNIHQINNGKDINEFSVGAQQITKKEVEKYINIVNLKTTAEQELINLQKLFLKSYKVLIQKLITKKDVIELIYEYRYYNQIPINRLQKIEDIQELMPENRKIRELLVERALDEKIMKKITNNSKLNMEILEEVFSLKLINLENTECLLSQSERGTNVTFLEGDHEEIAKEIIHTEEMQKAKIKEGKRIKIFNK